MALTRPFLSLGTLEVRGGLYSYGLDGYGLDRLWHLEVRMLPHAGAVARDELLEERLAVASGLRRGSGHISYGILVTAY